MDNRPRISPLPPEAWPEALRDRQVSNVGATLARNRGLATVWGPFAGYVRSGSTLNERIREVAVLRTAFRCGSRYEFAQHCALGREAGLTDADLEDLLRPEPVRAWPTVDRVVITAVDQLATTRTVDDATWAELAAVHDDEQLIDLLVTIGTYTMLALTLNTIGVALDPGLEAEPWIDA
jgi:alkylhydroperoxidase family enzyme